MEVEFAWIDVFAERPLEGNPLALVPTADRLTNYEMRAIAREFNQSETTFLVAPTIEGADRRLRSFTPRGVEVLGAGHNALGAWIWLAASQKLTVGRADHVQQIGEELLPVRVGRDAGGAVQVAMLQSPPRFLRTVDEATPLVEALGLGRDDLTPRRPEVVSTGAEHLLVELVDRAAVDRSAPDQMRLAAVLAEHGAEGCYVFSTERFDDGADAYTRFFSPTVGITEDPATGTAAGPLAALLVRDRAERSSRVRILQGAALGRLSLLRVRVDEDRVELSGGGIVVGGGTLHL